MFLANPDKNPKHPFLILENYATLFSSSLLPLLESNWCKSNGFDYKLAYTRLLFQGF